MNEHGGSRVALVTGAAGGIGSATVKIFREAGWRVVGVDVRADEALRGEGERMFDTDDEGLTILQADIADERDSLEVFRTVAEHEGRLDALVNNAAIQVAKSLVETTPAEWDAVFRSNLRAVYLAVRHGHGLMKARGGAIVNVASVHAFATSANIAAYAASKGGLVALTRAMAIELAPDGIRANAVVPGAVDTPMLSAGLSRGHLPGGDPQERLLELSRKHVLGRTGHPVEIAQAILFLADSNRSSFITGETLVVDGGALCRLSTE
jgi:glucose 1-dehydrogenase